MKNNLSTIIAFFFLLLAIYGQSQIRYVNALATGVNNGSSWQDAWTDLSFALENTSTGEIWVAEGVYKPTEGLDREASFELEPNIQLIGGFPNVGNPTEDDRDWEQYLTVLSGDLGIENDTSDNTFTILELSSRDDFNNTIDGFVFTAGNSDGDAGAIDVSGTFNFGSKTTIKNCIFKDNFADYGAAAIDASWTTLVIENCLFENNYAGYEGGAISYFSDHNSTDKVSLTCKNSKFIGNIAGYEGGAVDVRGFSYWYNCLFQKNTAENEGAVFSQFRDGVLNAVNCTFIENSTFGEGAVLNIFSHFDTLDIGAKFSNCIFRDNSGLNTFEVGGSVDLVTLEYSLIDENQCPPNTDCLTKILYNQNPEFVDYPIDLRLASGSPAVDAGLNDILPIGLTTDLAGNPRIAGSSVDLGAFEFPETVALKEVKSPFWATVAPNPFLDIFTIAFSDIIGQKEITISDLHGKKILTQTTTANELTINHPLPKGLLLLSVKNNDQTATFKILKQ